MNQNKQENGIVLQTKRLLLRQMKMDDEDLRSCSRFLADPEVMYAYEHGFNWMEIENWIIQNRRRYEQDGFGLWMVIEKKSGKVIGDCGPTWQDTPSGKVLEIGYHLQKASWHHGFATEAAKACRDYAFEKLPVNLVTSIIRDTNSASQKVAIRNGMHPIECFDKYYWNKTMPHIVYAITREEYEALRPQEIDHEIF